MPANQSLLILSCSAPYDGQSARAALDVALTAAAFEQTVKLVFVDAGVLQLLPGQDTGTDGPKNVGKMIPALTIYEVQDIYMHLGSAGRYGVDTTAVPESVAGIDDAALRELVREAGQVLVF